MNEAGKLLNCHGPQQRAIQAMKGLIWRVDARRLDGVLANAGIEPDHDS